MLLPIAFKADWQAIRARRQRLMVENNQRENAKRIDHEYKVGDTVAKTRPGIQRKLRRKRDGPFIVEKVFNNGTIGIRRGTVLERINIRRVMPYHEAEPEA